MNRPIGRIWLWPIALALFSLTGLVSALIWDGLGDVWSWIGLGVPAVVGCSLALRRRQPKDSKKQT